MANETDALKKDIEELRKALDALGKDVKGLGKELSGQAKSGAQAKVEELKDGARKVAEEVGAKGKQAAESMEETVKSHPLQSLAVAFGAGLLIAQLLRNR